MRKYFSSLLFMAGILIPVIVSAAKINAVMVGSKINVTINDKYFTSYIFSEDEKYPFFFPVNGPVSGGSVTSMRNAEYPHHSSLFFGCDLVNGGNYWQEGLERGRIISVNARIVKEGGDSVIITDECIWCRPGALSPVKDTRRFTITAPSDVITQIDAEITMEMLTDVEIKKTNHSLFSVRMAADLSVKNGGMMINAEGIKTPHGWIIMANGVMPLKELQLFSIPQIPGFPHPGLRAITDSCRLLPCTGPRTESQQT
jgi:hypothetical protein